MNEGTGSQRITFLDIPTAKDPAVLAVKGAWAFTALYRALRDLDSVTTLDRLDYPEELRARGRAQVVEIQSVTKRIVELVPWLGAEESGLPPRPGELIALSGPIHGSLEQAAYLRDLATKPLSDCSSEAIHVGIAFFMRAIEKWEPGSDGRLLLAIVGSALRELLNEFARRVPTGFITEWRDMLLEIVASAVPVGQRPS